MITHIEKIKREIEPLRQEIINHKVYSAVKDVDDLKVFMQYHVYAVWDFMSLLKALQNNLTCTSIPWFPVGSADTRYLINEIVVGEESDVDLDGKRTSHFELYLDAMKQCGADTRQIEGFINELQGGKDLKTALTTSGTPLAAREFVEFTFQTIESKKDYLQAAVFTFGREDLIPGMFISIVNEIHEKFPNDISIFKYYIERHIEVDGDHHSNLALKMTANLCDNNEAFWTEATEATIAALKSRIKLWDGVYQQLTNEKNADKSIKSVNGTLA
ncbi:DUF3050 domain-containing protein [Persicitalea jodogahamensis]|uniref:Heme oxygenase n=1 Tax=Persicitalea jodogahamensis TaxID=402147 RepID=A0A8J3G6Y5_9BACT|nr:DUF3050 domain-containing protein [Persicitalea jodogahamensis]GHB51736.1 hypothetical protein GCM10007390_00360 [Persicitalea jodogahamensis]